MATLGVPSQYASIAAAAAAARPGDTILLAAGYSNETATITVNNLTISGTASSTGINLNFNYAHLGALILQGDAPISVHNITAPLITDGNTITGNNGSNALFGGIGVFFYETLMGGGGDDIIRAGTGDGGTYLGGDGNDTLYAPTAPIPFATLDGGAGDDVIYATDCIDVKIDGGSGNDFIYLGYTSQPIHGGEGDDTLIATNTYAQGTFGDEGNDLFIAGNAGTDRVEFYGGDGIDTVSYANAVASVTVDLLNNNNNAGEAHGQFWPDVYGGIENIIGSAFDDTLTGDAGANLLFGGNGSDTASYAGSGVGLVVDLANPGANTGDAAGDRYNSIENLKGSNFQDTLSGDNGANTIAGLNGDDVLTGRAGDDFLDGGEGFDLLRGGDGDDFVFGRDGGGTLYGDAGNDRVDGGHDQPDTIFGGTGNDDLRVGNGDDFAYGEAGLDFILGADGLDRLYGGADSDTLRGENGNDILDGGAGADVMRGGAGNDLFYVDNAGDLVEEFEGGVDRVFASASYTLTAGANVETFTTTNHAGTGAINLTGNESANTIFGNAGANSLDGRAGADSLIGFGGDDFFFVDNAADAITERAGEGTGDRVFASVNYTLGAGDEVEIMSTTNNAGAGAINLTGNELANTIFGNAGANWLDGKAGADSLTGLGGNDFFFVDNAADAITEGSGEGTGDRVFASVTYTLGAGAQVEIMSTTSHAGTGAISLTGNELANTIFGNAGANVLNGKGANDTLMGFGGADNFLFDTTLNASSNVDRISDFSVADDTIQLENAVFAGLAAGGLPDLAFRAGNAAADFDDRIIHQASTGRLFFDADGVGGTAQVHFATVTAGIALTNADFIVV